MSPFETAVRDCIQNALQNTDTTAAIINYCRVLVDECGWQESVAEAVCERALVIVDPVATD
jgi:hypothetical protein